MESDKTLTPEFELPPENAGRKVDDSITAQGIYQRYWEARHLEKRQEEQRNLRGLNVYERARLGYEDDSYGR